MSVQSARCRIIMLISSFWIINNNTRSIIANWLVGMLCVMTLDHVHAIFIIMPIEWWTIKPYCERATFANIFYMCFKLSILHYVVHSRHNLRMCCIHTLLHTSVNIASLLCSNWLPRMTPPKQVRDNRNSGSNGVY